jgi:hypothetical protein
VPAREIAAPRYRSADVSVAGQLAPAKIATALKAHLRAKGLPEDSGVSLRWVPIRFLGVPIVFPNFDARREILVTHDVHHLLTGYATDWRGEGEIGAFEIATGCRRYWAAWFFNFGGFLFGLVIAPVRTWRAFVRGRHARNFYGTDQTALLERTVGDARAELGLDRSPPAATFGDRLAFAAWTATVIVATVVLPIATAWLLLAWIW